MTVNLDEALGSFEELWSPRIVARINDYDVRVTKVRGDYVWHKHDDTDEFFMVLDGELDIALREQDGERVVRMQRGDVFVIPKGVVHKPSSDAGASIVVIEPAGNPTTGDGTSDIPEHLTTTTGRDYEG
jgi:mannose-6-phosphate isomerase-like protein (cupin superfamily)